MASLASSSRCIQIPASRRCISSSSKCLATPPTPNPWDILMSRTTPNSNKPPVGQNQLPNWIEQVSKRGSPNRSGNSGIRQPGSGLPGAWGAPRAAPQREKTPGEMWADRCKEFEDRSGHLLPPSTRTSRVINIRFNQAAASRALQLAQEQAEEVADAGDEQDPSDRAPPTHKPKRLNTYGGFIATGPTDGVSNLAAAFREIKTIVREERLNTLHDSILLRYHERPGVRKRREQSERWRALFAAHMRLNVKMLRDLQRRGAIGTEEAPHPDAGKAKKQKPRKEKDPHNIRRLAGK